MSVWMGRPQSDVEGICRKPQWLVHADRHLKRPLAGALPLIGTWVCGRVSVYLRKSCSAGMRRSSSYSGIVNLVILPFSEGNFRGGDIGYGKVVLGLWGLNQLHSSLEINVSLEK